MEIVGGLQRVDKSDMLEMLLNNMHDHVYFKSTDSNFLYANKALLDFFDLNHESDIIGKNDFDFFKEEHALSALKAEKKIIKSGQPILNIIERSELKSGKIIWENTSKFPLRDQDDNIIGTMGISRDITDDFYKQQLLEEKERMLSKSQRIASMTSLEFFPTENIFLVSDNFENIVPYKGKLTVFRLFKRIHHDDLYTLREKLKSSKRSSFKVRFKSNDSTYIYLKVNFRKMGSHQHVYYLFTLTDITSDEKKKKRIVDQNNQLSQLNLTLDQFFSSVSNDLRAPIISASCMLDLIANSNTNKRIEHYLIVLRKSFMEMDHVTTSLVEMAKNQQIDLNKTPVALKPLTISILSSLLTDINKSVEFEVNIEDDSYLVTDKERLSSVLRNILHNAITYTHGYVKNPLIKVNEEKTKRQLTIKIEDNGTGITEEHLPHIFKLFYRGTEKVQGSGLGLYVANESIEKIGGKITVNSLPGKGSTFTISIPVR